MPISKNFDVIFHKELKQDSPSPINSLVFSLDGNYLISGGDDETVYVWNTRTLQRVQTIQQDDWGQITTLSMIYPEGTAQETNNKIVLCIGTGRGCLTMIPMSISQADKPFVNRDAISFDVFPFNDAVESQAFDKINTRLVVASHSGLIKMFSFQNMALQPIWSSTMGPTIPRAAFFCGKSNGRILTFALETAEMWCWDSAEGNIMWKKSLSGGIGSATLSDDQKTVLVCNLSSGEFDLYRVPGATHLQSLPATSSLPYIRQCQFLEGGQHAVCGSDTNVIYVVDLSSNRVIETLTAGKGKVMAQAVAVTSGRSSRVFIAGAAGGSVFIWEKADARNAPSMPSNPVRRTQPYAPAIGNELILLVVILVTYNSWSPLAWKIVRLILDLFNNGRLV